MTLPNTKDPEELLTFKQLAKELDPDETKGITENTILKWIRLEKDPLVVTELSPNKRYIKRKDYSAFENKSRPKETPVTSVQEQSAVQKAKEQADVQEQKAREAEAKQRIAFAEVNVKDANELKEWRDKHTTEQAQFITDKASWDSTKKLEESNMNRIKSELDKKAKELTNREGELNKRLKDLEARETLCTQRESLLTQTERKMVEDDKEYHSLTSTIIREGTTVITLLADNANIFEQVGLTALSDYLWDDIESMKKLFANSVKDHAKGIIEFLQQDMVYCNNQAASMARTPNVYREADWNMIIDNNEKIYKILPIVKPQDLPDQDN